MVGDMINPSNSPSRIELLEQLRSDYRDLAVPRADVLEDAPNSLQALRMICKGHPVVFAHGAFDPFFTPEGAKLDWDDPRTYIDICSDADADLTIAITDDGLADSVRSMPDGSKAFVKPLEEKMSMTRLLERITKAPPDEEILYLQSQDGNIHRSSQRDEPPELSAFAGYLSTEIPWMEEAVGQPAEAVNLWIGTSRSTTSFHHDPYENIYHVLSGSKTFTLVAPIEGLWLEQRFYPSATLHRTGFSRLEPVLDTSVIGAPQVPWVETLDLPEGVQAIKVNITAGESLYLPAEWWHRVDQTEGPGGFAAAINYWYPAEIQAERYAYERLACRLAKSSGMVVLAPTEDDAEDDI